MNDDLRKTLSKIYLKIRLTILSIAVSKDIFWDFCLG